MPLPFRLSRLSTFTTNMAQLQQLFTASAKPLPAISDPGFASHFDDFAKYKVVLLGDGSHGTSGFYSARAEITTRLIPQHGYTMVKLVMAAAYTNFTTSIIDDEGIEQEKLLEVQMIADNNHIDKTFYPYIQKHRQRCLPQAI